MAVRHGVDCVVIGAGVVGLAVARALQMAGRDVLVLEAADAIGTETSSRNSEVIHAGIYYPQGSLMAATCVAGRALLYEYCEDRSVPHRRCGKLIVATNDAEADQLVGIRRRAALNGVTDLDVLTRDEARALEPAVACVAALLSPQTGIIDSHAYMLSLQGDAENLGATFAFNAPVLGGEATDRGIEIDVGGRDPVGLCAALVINAAGLHAPALASRFKPEVPDHVPRTYFAKGNYFVLSGRSPFRRLIYPVPVPGGLGIHLTIDLAGQARFGPDVEWVDAIDYDVDPSRAEAFFKAVKRYWPGLTEGRLLPGYSGIRPKIVPPGSPAQDFMIQDASIHGIPGLIHLFGIESPGLTASLALAAEVVRRAGRQ